MTEPRHSALTMARVAPDAREVPARVIRLGAVSYLNTKPLVHGLEQRTDLFSVRFDVPAQCAALLH